MSLNMENNSALRRKDTTRGPPLRILSLDGGGVRGYSMLIIIQELMHRLFVEIHGRAPRRHEIPKPADHFDLILGAGTGGLIAIMLGRLRLDLETCKEVYTRMTRRVFETDKTIAGIPYRHTLFKASKLEEAIKECVRDHTVWATEGNDDEDAPEGPTAGKGDRGPGVQRHSSNASVVSFSARSPTAYAGPSLNSRYGNANALLYDLRENRTKTAVTAIYQGTPLKNPPNPALLRSYDSRAEPAPETVCKIWQAGRATSATGLAFKPIQIGQSVFIDEGAGKFNPGPVALDEATINEWPGREVGVFVSIGTGKRPAGSDANQHLWYEDFMGDFADARRRLIAKIEGCEETHQYMIKEYLMKRNVNPENYFRLNVEVGVGDFGMNEWNRLADISTSTRRYLGRQEVQRMNLDAAAKMAKIYKARERLAGGGIKDYDVGGRNSDLYDLPEANPLAVELPAEVPPDFHFVATPPRQSYESGRQDNLALPAQQRLSPRSSDEYERRYHNPATSSTLSNTSSNAPQPQAPRHQQQKPPSSQRPTGSKPPTSSSAGPKTSQPSLPNNDDRFIINAPTPGQYAAQGHAHAQSQAYAQAQQQRRTSPLNGRPQQPVGPPPIPPKTPIQEASNLSFGRGGDGGGGAGREGRGGRSGQGQAQGQVPPPYPIDDEAPPPVVNMARKPEGWGGR